MTPGMAAAGPPQRAGCHAPACVAGRRGERCGTARLGLGGDEKVEQGENNDKEDHGRWLGLVWRFLGAVHWLSRIHPCEIRRPKGSSARRGRSWRLQSLARLGEETQADPKPHSQAPSDRTMRGQRRLWRWCCWEGDNRRRIQERHGDLESRNRGRPAAESGIGSFQNLSWPFCR